MCKWLIFLPKNLKNDSQVIPKGNVKSTGAINASPGSSDTKQTHTKETKAEIEAPKTRVNKIRSKDSDDETKVENDIHHANVITTGNSAINSGFNKIEARYQYGTPGKISWRLSMKYPIVMLGKTKLFFIILPFYYVVAYPVSFVLNYADTVMSHKTGTGLIVKAWK